MRPEKPTSPPGLMRGSSPMVRPPGESDSRKRRRLGGRKPDGSKRNRVGGRTKTSRRIWLTYWGGRREREAKAKRIKEEAEAGRREAEMRPRLVRAQLADGSKPCTPVSHQMGA